MSNNISFEEIQAIIEHGDEAQNGSVEIVNQLRDKGLNIAPKKPENPTAGLLGRWVRHYSYGDVMCAWDGVDGAGEIFVMVKDGNVVPQSHRVHIDSLTFPDEPPHPRTVTTETEYATLPAGSIVVEEGIAAAIAKKHNGQWSCTGGFAYKTEELSGITRTVLREGWGE